MDAPTQNPSRAGNIEERYKHSHYEIKRQVMKLLGAAVRIYDVNSQLAFFVEQMAFKLKEDVRVYTDEGRSRELLSIKARSMMDFRGIYDVTDSATGQRIGALQRKGYASMIRDEWAILDVSGAEVGRMIEDSMGLALVRRFLTNLVPQSYDIEHSGRKVADFRQKFSILGYQGSLDFDPSAANFDRRMGIAAAVLLVLIEGRQEG
jgi:uncharacterized protein YxjI